MMIGFTVLVPFTFLGVYASEEWHLSYATATGFFTLMAVAGMAGKLILGVLSDRWGRIQVMMLCGLFLGTGCWGIVNFGDLQIKICCTVLVGFGFGAVWPVYAAAAIDFFPKSVAGSVIGLWTFFLGIGSIISPIVCGWSIDFTGSYTWAFNIGFGVAMISVALLLPLFKYSTTVQSTVKTVCES
jgi:MFS family permease